MVPRDDTWDQLILELGEFGAAHVFETSCGSGRNRRESNRL
jgi:hypothetical protein